MSGQAVTVTIKLTVEELDWLRRCLDKLARLESRDYNAGEWANHAANRSQADQNINKTKALLERIGGGQ